MISTFRRIAYVEAVSFLLLLTASFVKRATDGPNLVPVVGMVHGLIFLAYLVFVLKVRPSQAWSLGRTLLVIVAAAIPFGGFFVGRDLKAD